jgi:hypothetical protein
MIPRHIHPSWYRTYWFDPPRQQMDRPGWPARVRMSRAGRLEPALLVLVLLLAALATGAVLIALAPVAPADLPSFLS